MRIVFHAGMHKTATTAVQAWLAEQAELLLSRRVRALCTPAIFIAKEPARLDVSAVRAVVASAAAEGRETLIVSHESLSLLHPATLQRIAETLAGHDLRVVLTLRHWAGYLPSRWAQNCRRRDSQPFGAFLDRIRAAPRPDASFDLVVGALRRLGRIKVVSYDNASNMVVPTVLRELAGLDELFAPGSVGRAVGRSPPPRVSDRCRLFNGVLSEREGRDPDALFDSVGCYGPAGRLYDIERQVERILAHNPELRADLDAELDRRSETWRLLAADFAAWEARLEDAVGDDLANPVAGRLFAAPPECEVSASGTRVGDLAPGLRARMLDALAPLPPC